MPGPRRNPSRALAALAAAALALTLAACGGSSGSGSTGAPASTPVPGPASGRIPVYLDIGQRAVDDPKLLQSSLDDASSLGVGAVRLLVFWNSVAPASEPAGFDASDPADPGYDFSAYDAFMRAAAQRGLDVLVTISGPAPAWASTGDADDTPVPADFGRFAKAVARRYNGSFDPGGGALPGAALWSVWNEPNLSIFLKPQYQDGNPYSPILYRELYLAAQSSIEAADPGTPLLIGETAPTGSTDSVDPIPFTEAVLCLTASSRAEAACKNGHIDAIGWATHPYGTKGQAPYQPPPRDTFVTLPSLANLESVLDRGGDAGSIRPGLPVYISEYGVQSEPDPVLGVPLLTQASYISIAEYLAYLDPRIHSFGQYLVYDDPPDWVAGEQFGGFESGLRLWNGPPKPSFDGFRLPLVVRRDGGRVSIWGLVRPSDGPTEADIQVLDGGVQGDLKTVRTDGAGILTLDSDFKQGRLWRLAWRSPGGKQYTGPWTGSFAFRLPAGSG